MKHLTVKTSILALCAGAAFFIPAGYARAEAVRPVTEWSVTQAPFTDMGGQQSCTATTRFNNGYSMQLTGTSAGVQNLSIDVRSPAFQSGGIMDVVLSVPGVTTQQVQAQAYGNSLMVINMQSQKNILAAMRTRETLDVKVSNNSNTSFSLSGLGDAAAHFDQCVSGNNVFGSQPLVTEAPPAVPAPAVEKVAMTQSAQAQAPQAPAPVPAQAKAYVPPVPASDNIMSAAGTPPAPPRVFKEPGASLPPEQLDQAIAQGGMVVATAAPAQAAPAAISPRPQAAPIKPVPAVANNGSPNLVARKTPPVTQTEEQLSAQDMERMEKRQVGSDASFNADEEFKTVPITEIAPPPPAMDLNAMETAQQGSAAANIAPAAPAAAPVAAQPPIQPKRLSDQLAAEKASIAPTPQAPVMNEKAEPVLVPQTQQAAAAPQMPPMPAPVATTPKLNATPAAPVQMAAVNDFADPTANPPRSGRYRRMTQQVSGNVSIPPDEIERPWERPAARMAVATPAPQMAAPVKAAPAPAVEKTSGAPDPFTAAKNEAAYKASKETAKAEKQAETVEKAKFEAAWDAIPDAGEIPEAPKPQAVEKSAGKVTSRSSEFTPASTEDLEAKIIDRGNGLKEIRSPESRISKRVEKVEMDLTDVGMPEQPAQPAPQASQPSARTSADMDALQAEIQRLRAQNAMLDEDLKASLAESKHEETSVSSENWNLEQAAMRYNEAEREIQRLGEQLRKERAQNAEEKKQLESMLFDPAVTDQKQIAKLAEMEEKLRAAEAELANQRRTYEERMRAMDTKKQ